MLDVFITTASHISMLLAAKQETQILRTKLWYQKLRNISPLPHFVYDFYSHLLIGRIHQMS